MSGFLTDDEISKLREDLGELLPSSGTIMRASAGTAALYGAHQQTWAASGTVDCRLDSIGLRDASGMIAQVEEGRTYYQLSIPYNADLRDGDRFAALGQTYECLQVFRGQSSHAVRRAILATKDEGN